jgi:hypothetical protein
MSLSHKKRCERPELRGVSHPVTRYSNALESLVSLVSPLGASAPGNPGSIPSAKLPLSSWIDLPLSMVYTGRRILACSKAISSVAVQSNRNLALLAKRRHLAWTMSVKILWIDLMWWSMYLMNSWKTDLVANPV